MDLSQRQVRDAASDVPPGYAPPDLFTGALQHSDPKLSWDEGDKRRKKVGTHSCTPELGLFIYCALFQEVLCLL
jgi:hypothetical protein